MNVIENVDRRHCTRTVPMKVLALGLSRTGTESLRKALKILGYNDVYHGYSAAFENPPDCLLWAEAFRAKYGPRTPDNPAWTLKEWDALLGHCQAVCDVPSVCFAPELIAAYPAAKVILTNRDPTEWHRSVCAAIHTHVFSLRASTLSVLAVIFRSSNRATRPMFLNIWKHFYKDSFLTRGKEIYIDHYNEVRRLVGPDKEERLLEYRVQDGWEPLCKFLGVPVPEGVEFPSGNTIQETSGRIRALVMHELEKQTKNVLWVVIFVYLALIISRVLGTTTTTVTA